MDLRIARSLSPDWDVELELPFDLKIMRARYELPDGTPFDNPEGDLHHRTESLLGLSDPRLVFHRRFAGALVEGDSVRLGFGVTLPFGKIEDDPYRLGDMGLKHQHIQFGTGTLDPLIQVGYLFAAGAFAWHASAGLHYPLYPNSKGFRGPPVVDFSAGPGYECAAWLSLSLHYVGTWQGRAYWHGKRDPNSGFLLQGLALAAPVRVGAIVFRPTVLYVVDIDVPEGDTFKMDWEFSIGVELAFGANKSAPLSLLAQ
jgi:hypothetical protein